MIAVAPIAHMHKHPVIRKRDDVRTDESEPPFLFETTMQQVQIEPESQWIYPYALSTSTGAWKDTVGTQVRACIPSTFAAYGKLFHPIYIDSTVRDTGPWSKSADRPRTIGHLVSVNSGAYPIGQRLTWKEICKQLGIVFHPELTTRAIVQRLPDRSWPRNLLGPAEGTLDAPTSVHLASVLAEHTLHEDCYFYYDPCKFMWKPGSTMLLRGKLREVTKCFELDINILGMSPCFWWTPSREWCVATDYDLTYTLIGGSEALIKALVADDVLEVLPITLDARLDNAADRINMTN